MLIFQWLNNGIKMLHAKGFSSRPATLQDLQRFVQRDYLQNLQRFIDFERATTATFYSQLRQFQFCDSSNLLLQLFFAAIALLRRSSLSSAIALLYSQDSISSSSLSGSSRSSFLSAIDLLRSQDSIALLRCYRSSSQIKLHLPSLFYAVKFLLL